MLPGISDTLIIALIATLITGIVTPILQAWLQGRARRRERQEDAAERQAVALQVTHAADQAAVAARLLVASNTKVADKVTEAAGQAAVAARLLEQSNKKVADRVAGVAVRVAEVVMTQNDANKSTSDKLDVIHTLTNSQRTATLQSEYEGVMRELVLMKNLKELNKRIDACLPREEREIKEAIALAAIKATELKLEELRLVLEQRARDAVVVEKQIDVQKAEAEHVAIS